MDFIQNNMIFLNLIILMVGITSVHLGFSFLRRERHTKGFFKYSVFLLAIGNGLCSIGYSTMSMSPNIGSAFVFRSIGLLGIDIYIVAELILISSCLKISRLAEIFLIVVTSIASLLDLIIYGSPESNDYYRINNYCIYIAKDPYRQLFHYSYQLLVVICFFILGLLWAYHTKYKRDKRFVFFIFLSNFIFACSSLPDMFFSMKEVPFLHAFYCFGISFAFFVFYISSNDYTVFYITINSISKDIFSTLGTGLLVFDTNYHLTLSNDYAKKILGLDVEPYRIRLKEIFDLESGEPLRMFSIAQGGNIVDYRLTANVTGKATLVNFSCKMDKNKEPLCYILTTTDLTEENRLLKDAQAANAAKSTFLSNISHEIRTPINVITGMNELILRECKDDNILKYSENINVASRNLMALINDVLDFSKIESGKLEIIPGEFNIGSALNDCYSLFLSLTHSKNQHFSLECNSEIPCTLIGDDVRLKQILSNLISNAVKYTHEYGSISIKADYRPVGRNKIILNVSVTDTGIGIQEKDISKLFDNFQRLELNKNRTIQGTGLGLSITKNLVALMNGTISVTSKYGEGSEFMVRIPFDVADYSPVGDINERHNSITGERYTCSFTAENAHVLAVDDVQMNLDVFTGLLKHTGIKIDCALSGQDALEMMRIRKYDIVFLDHMMPEMDGIDVLTYMRNDSESKNHNTPIIMLTANVVMGADRNYLDSGFNDYLSKPIQPTALENMVIKHLPPELVTLTEQDEPKDTVTSDDSNVPQNESSPFIAQLSFLDTAAGLNFAIGDESFYRQILETYISEDKAASLENFYQAKDWPNYQIVAHSIKGTSLTIGAPVVSEAAKGLEFAVKEDRLEYIDEHHDEVIKMYKELVGKIRDALK
ncbi:Hpt domain-containing protein [Pseudobutyrivibrio sp. ACV-2]|uniref:ATP-binding protein n=1 Tax=Pseudobutyrivibrio sp. ACV-2 TaxID=1520801 RepID=UPI0008985CA8|nr:ATP-binding protein [Pseudobutyrivibrio sp. ACV-2]SEA71662.1 Hpt domain-containing protein [Pseudobutyrivibrio sp. ACV-2]